MSQLLCPGCGEAVPENRLRPGSRFGCEHCAGLTLEVVEDRGQLGLRQVHFVSCPVCDAKLEVSRDAGPGEIMRHCGRSFRLTYEFGAYSLE